MSEEKGRLFPDLSKQFIHIIGGGGATTCLNSEGGGNAAEQAIIGVVDYFPFLPFLHGFDSQAQLLAQLVDRIVVDIRNAGMHTQDSLHYIQRILVGSVLIIYKGLV